MGNEHYECPACDTLVYRNDPGQVRDASHGGHHEAYGRTCFEVIRSQLAEAVRKLDQYQTITALARELLLVENFKGVTAAALKTSLAAIRADSPRPAPLSPEAKAARKPLPPEALVGALQERVHVDRGRLVASQPLRAGEADCTCEPHRNYDDQFCPEHGKAHEVK